VRLCERIISVNFVIMPKIPLSGVSSRTGAGMNTREYANASHGPGLNRNLQYVGGPYVQQVSVTESRKIKQTTFLSFSFSTLNIFSWEYGSIEIFCIFKRTGLEMFISI
jgi:hypothetical protein